MEDLSKEVVAVILVIAIVISVLGTWLVLDSATTFKSSSGSSGTIQSQEGGIATNVGLVVQGETMPVFDTEKSNIGVRLK